LAVNRALNTSVSTRTGPRVITDDFSSEGFEERVGLGVSEIVNSVLSVPRVWPGASEHLIDREFATL